MREEAQKIYERYCQKHDRGINNPSPFLQDLCKGITDLETENARLRDESWCLASLQMQYAASQQAVALLRRTKAWIDGNHEDVDESAAIYSDTEEFLKEQGEG